MIKGGGINYFAYGGNLDIGQMETRQVPFHSRDIAILPGYRLVFNKLSQTLYPGHGVANVEEIEDAHVEGIIYGISVDALLRLDRFEGGYERKVVDVFVADSIPRQAVIYVAKPESIHEGLVPAPEYLERIFRGGQDVFTPEYIEELQRRSR
jgi:gamma-glutamylcyclotransferase (GGCT)/AIG2-like uncharacterized protein YtfP